MKKYLTNTGWMISESILSNVFNLVVVMIVARYLQPRDYGSFAYVMSLMTVFATLGQLGLDGLQIREQVRKPKDEKVTLGTVLALRFAGYAVGAALIMVFAFSTPQNTPVERGLFAVAATTMLVLPLRAVLSNWFKARVEVRYASIANLTEKFFGGVFKIALVALGSGLVFFGIAQLAATVIGFAVIFAAYSSKRGPPLCQWQVDAGRARELFGESWRLFLGSFLASIYINTDITMVRLLSDAGTAGEYAIASKYVFMSNFVAIAIATSVYPRLIESAREGDEIFVRLMKLSYSIVILAAYALIALIWLGSEPILQLTVGNTYNGAEPVMLLLVFALPFAFSRHITTRWVILKKKGNYLIASEAVGCALNIALNLVLIPRYGGEGAAFATLAAYVVSTTISLTFIREGRSILRILTSAFLNPLSSIAEVNRRRH